LFTDTIRQTNIGLRYYLNINPYELSLEEWAMRVIELRWIREKEAQKQQ
jgi:hypothetical protein